MPPHHVHISYASPRVEYRGAFSEEKKQDVREKNAAQQRTARGGYSEEKKQDVLEKDAEQHRTEMGPEHGWRCICRRFSAAIWRFLWDRCYFGSGSVEESGR